jgi:hypothetical protein
MDQTGTFAVQLQKEIIMSSLVYSLINLAYLTTGRRLYALKLGLEAALSLGLDAIAALIKEAIEHDTRIAAQEDAWERSGNLSSARGKSFELDSGIDIALGAVYSRLADNLRLFAENHPLVIASKEILAQIFPEGIMPIISLPFEEQLRKNQTIIDCLKGDLNKAVETCNLAPLSCPPRNPEHGIWNRAQGIRAVPWKTSTLQPATSRPRKRAPRKRGALREMGHYDL